MQKMKSTSMLKIDFIVSVMPATVPPQINHTIILCRFVVNRSYLMLVIIEHSLPTGHFGHYALIRFLLTLLLFDFLYEVSQDFTFCWPPWYITCFHLRMSFSWAFIDVVFDYCQVWSWYSKLLVEIWLKLLSMGFVCIFFSG